MNKEMLKKIDGFAKYVGGVKKMTNKVTKDGVVTVIMIDNGLLVVAFKIDLHFEITLFEKLNRKVLHRSKSNVYDNESITYDYETVVEILNVLEYV